MAQPLISSSKLEKCLHTLRDRSNSLSQSLTQRLATSPSGQNLLHIGPSLSTIPPDLHSLLSNLNPILQDVHLYEEKCKDELSRIVESGKDIRIAQRRAENAKECAMMYQDLLSGERDVKIDLGGGGNEEKKEEDVSRLEQVALLERAALTTLHLVQELKSGSGAVQTKSLPKQQMDFPSMTLALPEDSEKAQFLMKLSPRIRRLEADTIKCLTLKLEQLLKAMNGTMGDSKNSVAHDDLMAIGHCLRGLSFLGRGKEAESVFARIAIMPLIRSRLSIGRLDEGGSRGKCAGFYLLLDDIACTISQTYGPILRFSEGIFDVSNMASSNNNGEANIQMEVDLVTAGVWLPIATALMADTSIRMAIFSPGIASILQANYSAMDVFLSELAERLLKSGETAPSAPIPDNVFESFYFTPTLSQQTIQSSQERLYHHPITTEFYKKWNLPIYYQLRFGESCSRYNKAIAKVQSEGWDASVFTREQTIEEEIRVNQGFELPLFIELYDILLSLWNPDVILRPLTHRFLRGALQLIGRTVAFVKDGIEGKVKFGDPDHPTAGDTSYTWGERADNVAAVAWELTVLETCMSCDYPAIITAAVASEDSQVNSLEEREELTTLISDVLVEASQEISPLILHSWNTVIVNILIQECSTPLSAVKGVAATYRMTNRPPPTQPSPFLSTIIRPLKEFDDKFSSQTPPEVGSTWKHEVVSAVSDKYSSAVEELLETVKRTEVALKNRKTRRATTGGMSDGEKVKLQLFLDYKEFVKGAEEVGVDVKSVPGIVKLGGLTQEAESLWKA